MDTWEREDRGGYDAIGKSKDKRERDDENQKEKQQREQPGNIHQTAKFSSGPHPSPLLYAFSTHSPATQRNVDLLLLFVNLKKIG